MIVAAISILLTQNSNLSNQQLSFRQILYVYYTLYRKNRIIYLTWAYHPQIIVEQGLSPGSSDYESGLILPTLCTSIFPLSSDIFIVSDWNTSATVFFACLVDTSKSFHMLRSILRQYIFTFTKRLSY